ncbi:hypothetical protein ONE63_010776 [Megalurothrips usitatus]|uniref:Uncharacterized protein n=1 Tax=Megalurothrips usitatus TaxID=439358 RepID=A0AAV7XE20_9NEOP|nr:hypothetical protein ONE63_010776 [Megalurothrips usitatus]
MLVLQTLLPQSPPSFPVERIRCCESGRQVALYGPRGVAVLDVPRRWDLAGKFQAGSKACRSVKRMKKKGIERKRKDLEINEHIRCEQFFFFLRELPTHRQGGDAGSVCFSLEPFHASSYLNSARERRDIRIFIYTYIYTLTGERPQRAAHAALSARL